MSIAVNAVAVYITDVNIVPLHIDKIVADDTVWLLNFNIMTVKFQHQGCSYRDC